MPLIAIPLAYWAIGGLIVATGATIAWQQSGGPEATAEALNNLAQSMQGANQQAQAQSQTGAISTTCVGNCQPPPECNDLNKKIKERRDKVSQRHQELREDRHNLYYNHYYTSQAHPVYGSWMGHIEQLDGWQRGLRNLLDRARSLGCPSVSDDVNSLATRDLPSRPAPK